MHWNLEEEPITIEKIPAYAFDSDDEKQRVAALLEQYNRQSTDKPDDAQDSPDNDTDNDADDNGPDDQSTPDDDDPDKPENDNSGSDEPDLKITPDIDAGFGQLARERIDRAPMRYYVWLPAERSAGMWFDTHSMYYPFAGELFPV